jgi:T4 RnlA family RNA ligase
MGITDVSLQPEAWVTQHANYDRFIQDLISQGQVPLFEWCTLKQKVVLDYPVDRLILLAVRDVHTGEYMPLNMMLELAVDYDVEVVRRYSGTVESMQHLMDETRGLQDQEGWVVVWPHLRIKIKGERYITMHRAKEGIMRENGVLALILDEKLDDVKPLLNAEDRARLDAYELAFWQGVTQTAQVWRAQAELMYQKYGDNRKAFALEAAPDLDGNVRSAVFKAWGQCNHDWLGLVVDVVRKNLGSQTRVDDVRALWGSARWQMSEQDLDA